MVDNRKAFLSRKPRTFCKTKRNIEVFGNIGTTVMLVKDVIPSSARLVCSYEDFG